MRENSERTPKSGSWTAFLLSRIDSPGRIYVGLVLFSVLGQAVGRVAHQQTDSVAAVAGALVLAFGIWTSFDPYVKLGARAWSALAAIFGLGLSAELVGLRTGLPFGAYHYTEQWWPTVWIQGIGSFPLLLPFAWVLVAGSSGLAFSRVKPWWVGLVGAAATACGVDLIMEGTLAGKLDYWRWDAGGRLPGHSPVSNLAAWFVLSLVGALFVRWGGSGSSAKLPLTGPVLVLSGQCLLMLALRLG